MGSSAASVDNNNWSFPQYMIWRKTVGNVNDLWQRGGEDFLRTQQNIQMPTEGWYDGLSPEVTRGLWEPYNYGANQMLEQMGAAGGAGGGRGGYTGAAGAAMGRYYADASQKVGLDAWNMGGGYRQAALLPYTSSISALTGVANNMNTVVDPGNQTGSNVASGALGGASIGTSIAPGYGTAIGAVAGGLLGWMGS